MPLTVRPFLMFEGRAQEAIDTYLSLFPGARVLEMARWPAGGPAPEGWVMKAALSLGGLTVLFSDSYVKHGFTFTPSSSLFVDVESEAELDRLAGALAEGGGVLMAPANYGFSRKFAWVNDRFGVSWQINLP